MLEVTVDVNFIQHREELFLAAMKSWPKRMRLRLESLIYQDKTEHLDNPQLPFHERYAVVEKLSRLNDLCGYHHCFLAELNKLFSESEIHAGQTPVKILDIGAGGGGLLRRIHAWAKRKNISVELSGLDSNGDFVIATEYHLKRRGIPVTMYRADATSLNKLGDGSFDIVVSSYMVHHIRTAGKVAAFLAGVDRIAKRGWLLVDFDRRIYGPMFVLMVGFLLSGSWTLARDGIRSAQRAYRTEEINFIIEEIQKNKGLFDMRCNAYPFFPYWIIRGAKLNDTK